MADGDSSHNRNPSGTNQYGMKSIISDWPELPQLIQKYLDEGVKVKELVEVLEVRHARRAPAQRSIERIIKTHDIRTTRKSGLSAVEKGAAILAVTSEDTLGRWGARLVKERCALKSQHISRDFITEFRRNYDKDSSDARHPVTRKPHTRGLWSAGPNEEWCVDGHEKILLSMGIAVYGINDKYSRLELCLQAIPSARVPEVPLVLYLRTVRERGGVPVQVTSDKGSETGKEAAVQQVLRQIYQPFLDPDTLPPHVFVKSTKNITRERGWRPIWEKELANIHAVWRSGKLEAGFHPGDDIHEGISLWIWAKVVQNRLDDFLRTNATHRIRKQPKIHLPSGGRPIDFYERPEKYGGKDMLIRIPDLTAIDRLIAEHTQADVFQFGSDEMVDLAQRLFTAVHQPEVSATNAWAVFKAMINVYNSSTNY